VIGQAGDTRFPDQVVLPAGNVIVEHQPVVEKTAEAIRRYLSRRDLSGRGGPLFRHGCAIADV